MTPPRIWPLGLLRSRRSRHAPKPKAWLLVVALAVWAMPAQAQKTSAQLLAEISANLASGTQITAVTLRGVLNDMVTAGTVELQTTATLPVFNLTAPNAFYASGGGAIFNVTAQAGDQPRVALYAKYTAIQNSTIPEYGSVFDCNLNSGLGGGGTGLLNNKVCVYTDASTGPNAGGATWSSATNLIVGAGDTGTFKVAAEFDITNNSPDCAVGVKNCYAVTISGNVTNPITAYLNMAPPVGTVSPAAHYGILIGTQTANIADIEEDSGAATGLCFGCLGAKTHSIATIQDYSISPAGLWLRGTYANDAILVGSPPVLSINPSGQIGLVATSAPGTGFLAVAMSSSNLGIYFSSGTPTVTAPDGSINLDSTGALWLHKGGAWVAVTVP